MIFGPDLIEEAEVTVSCIQDNLRATKSYQESLEALTLRV
jgi:hypothetical protein